MLFDKSTKTHYLSARSVHAELHKSKRHHSNTDVLEFLFAMCKWLGVDSEELKMGH